MQQGYRWLRAHPCKPEDVVLIINDDTQIETDFLEKGLRVLEEHPNTLLLAQSHGQTSGKPLDRGVHADWQHLQFRVVERLEDINCLSTMGLFLRVGDMVRIGGFHPKLLPHFTSDYEYTMRAYRKGFKLMTDPSVKLWVDEETTWNREAGEERFIESVRRLFSKKSPVNPVVWMFFIGLACPWRWKLPWRS